MSGRRTTKAERWLAEQRWTKTRESSFMALDARARTPSNRATFAQAWPHEKKVDRWIEAALLEGLLTERKASRLRPMHGQALVAQARRGWGWLDAKERETVRARACIVAALARDWESVSLGLGGKPLGRVLAKSTKFASLGGLVRHVATAAKNGLGEGACAEALKEYARDRKCEMPVLWGLAQLAIEVAGGHRRQEVPERFGALLTGAPVKARAPVPLVDDPRVSVFERYMKMGSAKERKELQKWLDFLRDGPVRSSWDLTVADAITEAFMFDMEDALAAVLPKLLTWHAESIDAPEPGLVFRAMLGRPVDGWETKARADFRKFHRASAMQDLRRLNWQTQAAAVALACGDTALVKKLTLASGKDVFRPGKTFGDDARAVLRHYALAVEANASLDDVTPAWIELLVTRPPEMETTRPGGRWSWGSLGCLAFAHFHRIGGARPTEVLQRLRDTLHGRG